MTALSILLVDLLSHPPCIILYQELRSSQPPLPQAAAPLLLLHLVQGIVVGGYSRVVDGVKSDHHWVPDAALHTTFALQPS